MVTHFWQWGGLVGKDGQRKAACACVQCWEACAVPPLGNKCIFCTCWVCKSVRRVQGEYIKQVSTRSRRLNPRTDGYRPSVVGLSDS